MERGLMVGDRDDVGLAARLERELVAFNVRAVGAGEQRELFVRVGGADELIAGLTGWTWGDRSGIEMLWVHEERRGEGWGVAAAAGGGGRARRRGCVQMNVSSLTFQASDFYLRHGFVETGRTRGVPGGHADVHF